MTREAFVLIETFRGTQDVISKLRQMAGVKSAHAVTGPYDVIAVIEGKDVNELGNLVSSRMRAISQISRIITCAVVDAS